MCRGRGVRARGLWELQRALLERDGDCGYIRTCCPCKDRTCTQRLVGGNPGLWHPPPPRTASSVCRWPRAGCICHRADWLSPGKGEWAPPPARLTDSCAPQTTYKGKSSFQTYSDYLRWESFLQQQLQTFPEGSALRRGFQTCEHWKQIFMEIIGKWQPCPPRRGRAGGSGWGRGAGTGR